MSHECLPGEQSDADARNCARDWLHAARRKRIVVALMSGVRSRSPRRWSSLALLLALSAGCAGAAARSDGARKSAPGDAVVRVCFKPARGESLCTGSGTVIDRRGYVLTAFHVVGRFGPSEGRRAGWLRTEEGYEAEIAVAPSDREATTRRHPARIVRVDASLDLALLRVEAPKGSLPALALRPANAPVRVGESVTASGFMASFTTVHRGFGHVAGIDPNRRGELAWLRLDVLFQPGMSGGAVTDERGRLLAVPITIFSARMDAAPVSLARPVERIPRDWLDALARGEIDDFVATGIPDLAGDHSWSGTLVADDAIGRKSETRYFTMSPWQPGMIRVRPNDARVELLDGHGQVIRAGVGELEVIADESADATLAVDWPLVGDAAIEVGVDFEPGAHGPTPPPTSTLQLAFSQGPGSRAARIGTFAVLERSASPEDWLVRLSNPQEYAHEPAVGAVFVGSFAVDQVVRVPGVVCGREYSIVVVPDSGGTLINRVLVLARDPHHVGLSLP